MTRRAKRKTNANDTNVFVFDPTYYLLHKLFLIHRMDEESVRCRAVVRSGARSSAALGAGGDVRGFLHEFVETTVSVRSCLYTYEYVDVQFNSA
jgi:hypothetical protein